MSRLKVTSLNVRGLNDVIKRRQVFKEARRDKSSILCLQETYSSQAVQDQWQHEWGGIARFSHGTSKSKGVGILFDRKLHTKILESWEDAEGRALIVKAEIDDIVYTVASIYAPNKDNPEFIDKIANKVDELSADKIIMCGDWNLVMDTRVDSKNRGHNNYKSAQALANATENLCITDIWRAMHPDKLQFSWVRRKPFCASRLDMIFVSEGLAQHVESCEISPHCISDHARVSVQWDFEDMDRGPGIWKLNNLLLENEKVVKDAREYLGILLEATKIESVSVRWETIKQEMKKFFQQAGKKIKTEQCILYENLQEAHVVVSEELIANNGSELTAQYLTEIEARLECIDIELTKSSAFRARAKWLKDGEKNSKYFYALEKRNSSQKNISCLDVDGILVKERSKILEEMKNFYENLYQEDRSVKFNIQNETETKLTESERNSLEEDITLSECYEALFNMKRNKAPGCDGLSCEFYQTFWPEIGNIVLNVIQDSQNSQLLNMSARKGVVSLIPKKGKQLNQLKNWRPLTLLNTDYKILAKIMATRMKKYLPKLISDSQTGFMENRNISDNIRKAIDIVTHVNRTGNEAILINLDFEKCFDRISHKAVVGALEYFNFGPKFIDTIRLFFTEFNITITNAGHYTDFAKKTRGVNQGCPVSPYLFLLCAEILAHRIKNNNNIRGIDVNGLKNVISQFADDTVIFLNYEQICLSETMHELTHIEKNTGLKISYDKTTIHRLGSLRKTNAQLYTQNNIKWSDGDIEMLGITVSNSGTQSPSQYDDIILKADSVLSNWYNRSLTIIGKKEVINTLVSSLFVYPMSVLPKMTDCQIKRLYRNIVNYLWKGKHPKIALSTLQAGRTHGGLNLCNFQIKQSSLYAAWAKKVMCNDAFSYVNDYLIKNTGYLPWLANISASDIRKCTVINSFWHEVWFEWSKLNFKETDMVPKDDIIGEVIWANSNIRQNGTWLLNVKAIERGLFKIADIVLDDSTDFLPYANLTEKFGNVLTWLDYEGIKKAIPNTWKRFLFSSGPQRLPDGHDQLGHDSEQFDICTFLEKRPAAYVYNYVNRLSYQNKCILLKLNNSLDKRCSQTVTRETFTACFKNIYKITSIVKLRSFQYRLLLNRIPANSRLHQWKVMASPQCDYCNLVQDPKHLFWECVYIKSLWDKFSICMENNGIHLSLTYDQILLNNVMRPAAHVVNLLVLIIKQLIYRAKCNKKKLTWQQVMYEIKTIERLERYNTTNVKKHMNKWELTKALLSEDG